MSDSNWGLRVAALGALACLTFVTLGTGAFFGALNAPHYGYQAEYPANRTSQAEQSNPSQVDRDRAGLPYFAERIASGPDPEDGSEREKRDLAAQESMSVWAFWLLLVSAIGTLTTMIGTGFLLWQIILTREAVKDTGGATKAMVKANEIAQQANRAWLMPEPPILAHLLNSRDENGKALQNAIGLMFEFQNAGNTPALSVGLATSLVLIGKDAVFEECAVGIGPIDESSCNRFVAPRQKIRAQMVVLNDLQSQQFRNGELHIFVRYKLVYGDIYCVDDSGNRPYVTDVGYTVRHNGGTEAIGDEAPRDSLFTEIKIMGGIT